VLLIATIFSFALAEGACRVLNLGSWVAPLWEEARANEQAYQYEPSRELLYRYSDNPRGYFDENNEVRGTINSAGFRGKETDFEKRPGTTRIAFLGDSFVLGIGVRDAHTLPVQFENEMQGKADNVEVLNFGVSDSSTDSQVELLENYVLKFDPDVVIIVLFLNDPDRKGTKAFFSGAQILSRVRKFSYFAHALIGRIERPLMHRRAVRHYREGFDESSVGWMNIKDALRKGKSLSVEHDFQLVISIYPILFQLGAEYPFRQAHRTVMEFSNSIDVPFVDLLDAFVETEYGELWVHKSDQHPNEVAHNLAARWLSEFFTEQRLPAGAVLRPSLHNLLIRSAQLVTGPDTRVS
jgi:lysophospholipase L1-like esterase